MFEEKSYVDKIEIVTQGDIVQVRVANEIYKDSILIATSFNRYTLEKGADLADQPKEVEAICKAAWNN